MWELQVHSYKTIDIILYSCVCVHVCVCVCCVSIILKPLSKHCINWSYGLILLAETTKLLASNLLWPLLTIWLHSFLSFAWVPVWAAGILPPVALFPSSPAHKHLGGAGNEAIIPVVPFEQQVNQGGGYVYNLWLSSSMRWGSGMDGGSMKGEGCAMHTCTV